ncbi:MAG TPA: sensor histidine kinase [Steroidobacteraceae bacterium]|nr:sensor histidine kinase [Steroidobacteraceae bacterium]
MVDRWTRWISLLWLAYLLYLFLPMSFMGVHARWIVPTLISIVLFVPLYVWACMRRGPLALWVPLTMALFSFVMAPVNPCAYVYLIYGAAMLPLAMRGLARPLAMCGLLVAIYGVELVLTVKHYDPSIFAIVITLLVAPVVCCANYGAIQYRKKQAALQLSQEKIRHYATIAERERIGRDLHDLLGHTLSLVALKSELAGKLVERDPAAAAREIAELERVARDALRQVREAVLGFKTQDLEAELTSARALLESSDVSLTVTGTAAAVPRELDSSLAMIVREAVTNIHRHAKARRASIEVANERGRITLRIHDDGRGGITAHGSGLSGIRERVNALQGTLAIDSPRGRGTTLIATLPGAIAA